MHSITDGIYYEDVYAGVVLGAVILPKGILFVDTPFRPDQARAWKSYVLTQGRGIFRILLNLDEHVDRTLGNRYIDLTILAHQATQENIANRTNIFKGQQPETGSEWEKYPEMIGARWTLPDLTYSNQMTLHWSDDKVQIVHRPGPSRGATWVEIPEKKVLFVGDAISEDQPPFLADADIPSWLEILSLLRRRKYQDYTIISGRSGPVSHEAIKVQQAFLRSIQGRLERLANRNAPPKNTAKMVTALLEKLTFPTRHETFYRQRLHFGLQEYYKMHYFQPDEAEQEV
jgi:glyoxylase-like metal-dependent hydrolase (beta-lactamase superfamily II)